MLAGWQVGCGKLRECTRQLCSSSLFPSSYTRLTSSSSSFSSSGLPTHVVPSIPQTVRASSRPTHERLFRLGRQTFFSLFRRDTLKEFTFWRSEEASLGRIHWDFLKLILDAKAYFFVVKKRKRCFFSSTRGRDIRVLIRPLDKRRRGLLITHARPNNTSPSTALSTVDIGLPFFPFAPR